MNYEEENTILKNKVNELSTLLETVQHKLNEIKQKNDYIQMIVALNDISICFSLGYKLKNSSFHVLNEDARIHGHYVDYINDSGELKRAKMIVLYEKIKNMENPLREKIEEYYPRTIHYILLELIHVNTDVSPLVMKRVHEWWN